MNICKGEIDAVSKFRILCNHPESDCTFFEYFDAVRGLKIDPLINIIGEPEQFTCVCDKKDKEIYVNDKDQHGYVIQYWKNMCAFMRYNGETDTFELLDNPHRIEIVGNIHGVIE